jgi:two-component system, chemotaxis family, protein-glutamate methylesterase/glutaminase
MPASRGQFHVVAMAASAGGLNSIRRILSQLPSDFPAAVLVLQHVSDRQPSHMAEILERTTPLPVTTVAPGDRMRPAAVFVAPPGRHLIVNPDGTLSLTATAPVHFVRPSADVLFESLAADWRLTSSGVPVTARTSGCGARAAHREKSLTRLR